MPRLLCPSWCWMTISGTAVDQCRPRVRALTMQPTGPSPAVRMTAMIFSTFGGSAPTGSWTLAEGVGASEHPWDDAAANGRVYCAGSDSTPVGEGTPPHARAPEHRPSRPGGLAQ